MTVEIVRERELVDLGSDTIEGGNRVAVFEYQYPVDLETVAVKRRLLGLDGGEAAPFDNKTKSVVATELRRVGFLTDLEIENLGGILLNKTT